MPSLRKRYDAMRMGPANPPYAGNDNPPAPSPPERADPQLAAQPLQVEVGSQAALDAEKAMRFQDARNQWQLKMYGRYGAIPYLGRDGRIHPENAAVDPDMNLPTADLLKKYPYMVSLEGTESEAPSDAWHQQKNAFWRHPAAIIPPLTAAAAAGTGEFVSRLNRSWYGPEGKWSKPYWVVPDGWPFGGYKATRVPAMRQPWLVPPPAETLRYNHPLGQLAPLFAGETGETPRTRSPGEILRSLRANVGEPAPLPPPRPGLGLSAMGSSAAKAAAGVGKNLASQGVLGAIEMDPENVIEAGVGAATAPSDWLNSTVGVREPAAASLQWLLSELKGQGPIAKGPVGQAIGSFADWTLGKGTRAEQEAAAELGKKRLREQYERDRQR